MRFKKSAAAAIILLLLLPCFLQPASAQNRQNGAIIADKPLPFAVFVAQQNKMQIVVEFWSSNQLDFKIYDSSGTGFLVKSSGVVVIPSARHVFIEPIFSLERRGWAYKLDPNGIPEGIDFYYKIYAVINDKNYPLSLVAMGEWGTYRDFMILKSDSLLPVKILEFNTNAMIGDTVYNSGFAPHFSSVPYEDASSKSFRVGIIDYTFEGKIIAKVPVLNKGLKKIYRIKGSAEHGFSGGPVFDKNGKVIGVLIEGTNNFVYVVSAGDIIDFIEFLKQKGIIK